MSSCVIRMLTFVRPASSSPLTAAPGTLYEYIALDVTYLICREAHYLEWSVWYSCWCDCERTVSALHPLPKLYIVAEYAEWTWHRKTPVRVIVLECWQYYRMLCEKCFGRAMRVRPEKGIGLPCDDIIGYPLAE